MKDSLKDSSWEDLVNGYFGTTVQSKGRSGQAEKGDTRISSANPSPDRRSESRSPDGERRSYDARRRSSDDERRSYDRRSPDDRRRSPDDRRRSPDDRARYSDASRGRARSPDDRRRSDNGHSNKQHRTQTFRDPTSSVMVRNIGIFITEDDLSEATRSYNPLKIRVIRNTDYGEVRSYAFIEFKSVERAREFVEDSEEPGTLRLKGQILYLDYSTRNSDREMYTRRRRERDWMCPQCGVANYAKRKECKSCREPWFAEDDMITGSAAGPVMSLSQTQIYGTSFQKGYYAREVLMVEGILSSTEEDTLRYAFAPMSPVKSAVILGETERHNRTGFVEFHTSADARLVLSKCIAIKLTIDNVEVKVTQASDHGPWRRSRSDSRSESRSRSRSLSRERRSRRRRDGERGKEDGRDRRSSSSSSHRSDKRHKSDFWDRDEKDYVEYFERRNGGENGGNMKLIDMMEHQNGLMQNLAEQVAWGCKSNSRPAQATSTASTGNNPSQGGAFTDSKIFDNEPVTSETAKSSHTQNVEQRFLFDESSGLYYDHTSGYYYDPNTKLYLHASSGIYYLWDETANDYVQANVSSDEQVSDENSTKPEEITENADMENGTLKYSDSSQLDNSATDSLSLSSTSLESKKPKVAVKFSMKKKSQQNQTDAVLTWKRLRALDREDKKRAKERKKTPSKKKIANGKSIKEKPVRVKPVKEPSVKVATINEHSTNDSKHLDFKRKACLLCRRGFKSTELLLVHEKHSELHKKNLEISKLKKITTEHRKRTQSQQMMSRPSKGEKRYRRELDQAERNAKRMTTSSSPPPLDKNNVGNRMLKNMGWSDGQGLGARNEGIKAPIEANRYSKRAGLGSEPAKKAHTTSTHDSYQSAAMKRMRERFHDLEKQNTSLGASNGAKSNARSSYIEEMQRYARASCKTDTEHRRPLMK